MQNQPLVTVYIPTFNRVELLKRAVKSVQDQTYQNLEIIIVDDCSTDGTHEYLEQVSKEDHRIRYFLKEKNSGACVSRNIAIENSKGEFITGLDDDDYFLEQRIKLFVENWNGNYSALFSNFLIKKDARKFRSNKRFSLKELVNQNDLLKANHIGNQLFTRREYLLSINGFDSNMHVWQDLECWYRLTKKYGYAKAIKKNLYVVDISHPHERITNKKIDKVLSSFNYFVKSNNLNLEEAKDLECHKLGYGYNALGVKVYVRRFLNFKTLGNLYLLLKKIFT